MYSNLIEIVYTLITMLTDKYIAEEMYFDEFLDVIYALAECDRVEYRSMFTLTIEGDVAKEVTLDEFKRIRLEGDYTLKDAKCCTGYTSIEYDEESEDRGLTVVIGRSWNDNEPSRVYFDTYNTIRLSLQVDGVEIAHTNLEIL